MYSRVYVPHTQEVPPDYGGTAIHTKESEEVQQDSEVMPPLKEAPVFGAEPKTQAPAVESLSKGTKRGLDGSDLLLAALAVLFAQSEQNESELLLILLLLLLT